MQSCKRRVAVCETHGETEFRERKSGNRIDCLQCNRERVYKWRQEAKRKLVEVSGGACVVCGYNRCMRALHFHHLDPKTKTLAISAFMKVLNYEKMLNESKKCVLLCSNCHSEVEDGWHIEKIQAQRMTA